MSLLAPEKAWRKLAEQLAPLAPVTVARERALGRVLATGVEATVDLPPCDVSAMDGYAVAEPVAAAEALPVAATLTAGDAPGFELEAGTAVRVMTGAPAPHNAAAVVPVELTDGGEIRVTFSAPSTAGAHIRRRGEVTRAGNEILAPGTALGPSALALLAAHGVDRVAIHGDPTVATLATGNEIVPAYEEPGPGQLRDSHTDFLLAAGATFGLEFDALGIARDDTTDLARHIERGLERDVLLISGGVSKGVFDLVEDVLATYGCETLFDAVAVQPGKPLVGARHDNGWVFGLPGNPASAMVCFWLFVRPLLRTLMGFADGFWHGAMRARLGAPLPGAKGVDRFLTASLAVENGDLLATPHPPQGSHDVVAYGHGAALVRIPARSEPKSAGDDCEVLPLSF